MNGDYIATIRCMPAKQVVFFVVAGPDSDSAGDKMNAIATAF